MEQPELPMVDQATARKAYQEHKRALQELEAGNVLSALARVEMALKLFDNPEWYPLLGFCIAKERGHVSKGLELCRSALTWQPEQPEHYYYLGRVLLVANRKDEAIQALRQGLGLGDCQSIKTLLHELGIRKPPVIPWLHRDNLLNKWLGIFLRRIGLR